MIRSRLFVLTEYVKGLDKEPGFRVFGVALTEEVAQLLTQGDTNSYTEVELDSTKGIYLRVENIKAKVD